MRGPRALNNFSVSARGGFHCAYMKLRDAFAKLSLSRGTVAFVAAAVLLYGIGIFWGLPSALSSASDSPAPLGPLAFVAEYRDPSKSYVYPAVHQLVLLGAYAVVIAGFKLAGRLGSLSGAWPYGFDDPTAAFSALILASNLVSVAMGVGLLLLVRRLRPSDSHAAWFSVALLGLSGVFAYYARVANLDVPYLFWWALSYALLWRYLFGPRARVALVALAGAAGALSIGTKDQAAGLFLGFGLLLLFVAPRGDDTRAPWAKRFRAAAIFACALVATYALVAVATNPWRWVQHVRFVTSDHVLPEYEQNLRGQLLLAGRALVRLSHVLSPLGVALGLVGAALLVRARRFRELAALALPALAYYVSIIAKVRATEERYMLPIAVALAVGAGVAVGAAWRREQGLGGWPRAAVLVLSAAALMQQLVYGFAPVTYTQLFDTKRELALDLGQVVPEGSALVVADMPSFNVPNRDVYERYRLTHPPGEKLFPPSTHGENLFHPYDPAHRFVLSGAPVPESDWWPGARSRWPDRDVELVRQWTYPAWVKRHVHVPSVYEFYLFRRRQATPASTQSGDHAAPP